MVFQTYRFAVFLLAAVVLFYALPKRARLWVLFLCNLIFFLSADRLSVVWLAISIASTWGCSLALERFRDRRGLKRLLLFGCVAINLALLVMFRYLPVWEKELNAAFGHGLARYHLDLAGRLGLVAPLGISFYTLQALGYLLDVSSGRCGAEKNPLRYAVFVSFFPNLSSGPIERGSHFLAQLDRVCAAKRRDLLDYDRLAQGMISILWGFFLKMVLADRAAIAVDYLYSVYQNTDSFTMMMAALLYSIQIYCDFASYTSIALGAASLFGFQLLPNFRQPYFALGIRDFWSRWHISLTSWLRDYVYIPLGGNRRGAFRGYLNILIVFLVSGLWHGGSPTFLVWGLLHGMLLILERLAKAAGQALKKTLAQVPAIPKAERLLQSGRSPAVGWFLKAGRFLLRFVGRALTFATVSVLWIFFRSDNLEMAFTCLTNLFTRPQGFSYVREFLFVLGLDQVEMGILACGVVILLVLDLVSELRRQEAPAWIYRCPLPLRFAICLFLLAATFIFGIYGINFNPSSFIYIGF